MDPIRSRISERIQHISADSENPRFFDLSTSGVCCLHTKELKPGSTVSVEVGDLSLKAKVVHCTERTDGFRIGLQFAGVDTKKQKLLEELVEKYSRGVPVLCGITGGESDGKGA